MSELAPAALQSIKADPLNVVQGSDAWRQARTGWATASRMSDLLATIKSGGYGASRDKYRIEKVVERLTGQPQDIGFQSKAMLDGIEREPEARAAYCLLTDNDVQECGFIPHPKIDWLGCSPDGLVGDDGLIEIKAPEPPQHWRTIRFGEIKPEYKLQVQTAMACCQRDWTDFVSYNPTFPPHLRLKIIRVPRDEKTITQIESEARRFLDEVDAEVQWARNAGR